MKFIYITDTHGQASSPGSRLDVFSEAILKKMKYIGEYAKEIGATAILHGGDWVHTPDVSESFIRELARIVNDYPCPTLGVLGNHDIYGYNPETFNRTSFGVAEGVGVFHRLYRNTPYTFEKDGVKVHVTGQDSYFNLDKEGYLEDYTESYTEDDATSIHIVHGMLVERKWPQCASTAIEEIENCKADIVLSGHEHTGFGVIERNNRLFCNPGSLARVTAGVGDCRKDVRMAVITIDSNGKKIELVNLPSEIARPASEVLDMEKLALEKANKERLESFVRKMNSATVREFNIYQSLDTLCKEEELGDTVYNKCREHLQKAEEEIKKNRE